MKFIVSASITFTMLCLSLPSFAADSVSYVPYTVADIDAKMACAVAIAKAEFYAGKLGVFGTPRVCHGTKAAEIDKWTCVSDNLDRSKNFAVATDACEQK